MFRFRPTRFQTWLLHLLLCTGLLWLLLLTAYKEYWGFWQSPEVYSFLKHEYPQWLRDYVTRWYAPYLWFSTTFFLGWMIHQSRELIRSQGGSGRRAGHLLVILLFCAAYGVTLGVRGANNLIGWLDNGKLHGSTSMQVRE